MHTSDPWLNFKIPIKKKEEEETERDFQLIDIQSNAVINNRNIIRGSKGETIQQRKKTEKEETKRQKKKRFHLILCLTEHFLVYDFLCE